MVGGTRIKANCFNPMDFHGLRWADGPGWPRIIEHVRLQSICILSSVGGGFAGASRTMFRARLVQADTYLNKLIRFLHQFDSMPEMDSQKRFRDLPRTGSPEADREEFTERVPWPPRKGSRKAFYYSKDY